MVLSAANMPVLDCPPDKSITHRLFFFGAMARGKSVVRNPLICGDTRSSMSCLKQLGIHFSFTESHNNSAQSFAVEIESQGFAHWRAPEGSLDAGNSGTTARLLLGAIASHPGIHANICGDVSLSKRPMGRVLDLLKEAGANSVVERHLPVSLTGRRLKSFSVHSEVASAQVKTAMVIAALAADGESTVTLPAGSRNHTEILCERLGIPVVSNRVDGGVLPKEVIRISGPVEVPPFDLAVPGDPSSAAFLVAAGLLSGTGAIIRQVCANPLRTAFLDVLDQAGVNVTRDTSSGSNFVEAAENWEVPAGFGSVRQLRGVGEIPAAWAASLIDEVPVLATILAFGVGPSVFRSVGELRVKESDRLAGIVRLLRAAGCKAECDGDDLVVAGNLRADSIQSFEFDSEGDHRLAMCAMVLERIAKKTCKISQRSCVDVSFPDFPAVLTSWHSSFQELRS